MIAPSFMSSTGSAAHQRHCHRVHHPLQPLGQCKQSSQLLPAQVVRAQVPPGFGSSLAKLQPCLWKILSENLGSWVINLQLVGGERQEHSGVCACARWVPVHARWVYEL